ncbi:MAG TPA: hypothetical protein PLO19_06220 [Candidatus Cryosericum sp.]|nr:hypothetical protein [Candidatus Cryosericum sp.]HPS70316.1 hypothetical protein [Candidatus Cryosericum sp.]
MNRKRMRTTVILLVVLSLLSGGLITLVMALRTPVLEEPVTVLPGVTLTPQDFTNAGLGTPRSIQYAGSSFVFYADANGAELADARSGFTVELDGGASVTVLCGRFADDATHTLRDKAYAWYRSEAVSTGLVDDTGASVIGDASAHYASTDVAAVLVRRNDAVFTLLYSLSSAAQDAATPLARAQALARTLASRL